MDALEMVHAADPALPVVFWNPGNVRRRGGSAGPRRRVPLPGVSGRPGDASRLPGKRDGGKARTETGAGTRIEVRAVAQPAGGRQPRDAGGGRNHPADRRPPLHGPDQRAKRARARKWRRARFTWPVPGPASRWWPSIAARFPKTCWKPSCSDTSRARSRARFKPAWDVSSRRTRAPCSWTRSATCRSNCKPSCSECCRTGKSSGWEARRPSRWMCG